MDISPSPSSGLRPNVLVMGVGSILMTDEGIGIRAIEELQKRYRFPENVELLDGGTSGIELLSYISRRDYLVIIDAIKSGNAPGTVLKVEGEDVPAQFRTRISPHQLGISDLLAAAMLTDEMPKRLVLFGIEPKDIVFGIGLSREVREGLAHLLEVVADDLRSVGCEVVKLEEHEISQEESIWGKV
ncbi:MAG: HyaD/HybD family hydrogenase maturation endopeptidase [Nitrospirae bacterium]|nr:HyaD/HybD family hydrogenase maturation endopeptidase [Nitrospirota bacterium]